MGVDLAGRAVTIAAMKSEPTGGTLLSRRFRILLVHLAEQAGEDLKLLRRRPTHAVHGLRTRMKQLRAILGLIRKRADKKRVKAILDSAETLKDAFSVQRDAHVIATLTASIGGMKQGSATRKNADVAKTHPNPRRLAVLAREVRRLVRLVSSLDLKGISWERVFEGYVRSYRDARVAMKACQRNPSAKSLHRWRRPVKEVFFQSQVLRPIDDTKRRTRLARRLGDRLGEFNDLDMLEKSAVPGGNKKVRRRIAKRKGALKQAAFKMAAKVFAEKPRELRRKLDSCLKYTPRVLQQCLRQL